MPAAPTARSITTGDNQTTNYTYDTHGRVSDTQYPDLGHVYQTWHIHNGALHCVVDQRSVETTYTYQAVGLGDGSYGVQMRQFVSAVPEGLDLRGDQEVLTTTDGLAG